MRHHFGDFLDRSGGHWKIVPNMERYKYQIGDWANAQPSMTTLTMHRTDKNWERASTLPQLEELTLHEPSADQLQFVSQLWRLKRLRISHARPKSLDCLARLQNLEELVLEYVSGFESLAPVGKLNQLRAVHFENLRGVRDFSGLAGANELRYLGIWGTLDWSQPIEGFEFIGNLQKLEYFKLCAVRSLAPAPALLALARLRFLKNIRIAPNIFPLEEYALVEAALPGVEGAVFAPYTRWASRYVDLDPTDIRTRIPLDQLKAKFPEVRLSHDGRRQIADATTETFEFLGKKAGSVKCNSPKAAQRCADYSQQYLELKNGAKRLLDE